MKTVLTPGEIAQIRAYAEQNWLLSELRLAGQACEGILERARVSRAASRGRRLQ